MTTSAPLNLLCAGAVQGLVKALATQWQEATGAPLQTRFGAVGALKEALLGGAPCDVMIVTDAMVRALQASGELRSEPGAAALGRVRTGVAVRGADAAPDIATPAALKSSLLAASAIYGPDTQRSTAGIHFASVLDRLGIATQVAPRLHVFPNGATAMRELAAAEAGALGCTQITEILYTPRIRLVAALPAEFELATVYSAAVATRATQPELAQRFVELLAGQATRALRAASGFEFDPLG